MSNGNGAAPGSPAKQESATTFKCAGCGALLRFEPGTASLGCEYCGTDNVIKTTASGVKEPYQQFIAGQTAMKATLEQAVVKCTGCGASVNMPANVTSDTCPFCAAPMLRAMAGNMRLLRPHGVLPFAVDHDSARRHLAAWAGRLWFAPSDLAKSVAGSARRLQGVYMPYWCYDTATHTRYSGERGDYYYTTETYTYTENGQTRTGTRQVRHTRWSAAHGDVSCGFLDLLVSASPSLPQDTASVLEPWDMGRLVAFDERFLSGLRSETYQVDPVTAFGIAKQKMVPTIEQHIRADIGGDEQRINRYETAYIDTAIAYHLLPVWLCAYRHEGKPFQVIVNASTGEVTGERPYSTVKIVLFCLFIAALVFYLCYLYAQQR